MGINLFVICAWEESYNGKQSVYLRFGRYK